MTVLTTSTTDSAAPTGLSLSNDFVWENAGADRVVGSLSVLGGPEREAYTFELLDDAGGRFSLEGDQIIVKEGSLLDFERATSHTVLVLVTGPDGASMKFEATINVGDIAESAGGLTAAAAPSSGGSLDVTSSASGADSSVFTSPTQTSSTEAGIILQSTWQPRLDGDGMSAQSPWISSVVDSGSVSLHTGTSGPSESSVTASTVTSSSGSGGLTWTDPNDGSIILQSGTVRDPNSGSIILQSGANDTLSGSDVTVTSGVLREDTLSVDDRAGDPNDGLIILQSEDNRALTYTLDPRLNDDSRFYIENGVLKIRAGAEFDTGREPSVTLAVSATDGTGTTTTEKLVIIIKESFTVDDAKLKELADLRDALAVDWAEVVANVFDPNVDTGGISDPYTRIDNPFEAKSLVLTGTDFVFV